LYDPLPPQCLEPSFFRNIKNIFAFVIGVKIWAVLHLCRGSMDAGNNSMKNFNNYV
jgi:hypothetical protein